MVVLTSPMHRSSFVRRAVFPALLALPFGLAMRPDAAPHISTRMSVLPPVTLWSWERREDLRGLDARRFAIAYLDQTLTIDLSVHRETRRNPILLSSGAVRIPVVRIEPLRHAIFNDVNREAVVQAILLSAEEPHIAALQIDFDATASERGFYRDVLAEIRQRMPAALPLSMTALASWCSYDDWLGNLPVEEAVPMMFRMEPDRRRAPRDGYDFVIREPLCRGAVGVSTGEPWPAGMLGKRLYVFSDEGWRAEKPAEPERRVR
jgi:hypothetical protein